MAPRSPSKSTRAAIVRLRQTGFSVGEVAKQLGVNRQMVWRSWKRYTELGSTQDRAHPARKNQVRTPDLREKIRKRILRNPRRSMRGMAGELSCSERTVRRIVHEDLNLKALKPQKAQTLTPLQQQKRVDRLKQLRARAAALGWHKILWLDEKLFSVQQVLNKQNHRILASSVRAIAPELQKVTRRQGAPHLMVWAGFSAGGKAPLVFFDPKTRMNAQIYQNQVLEVAVKDAGRKLFGNGDWLYMQDGASSHTAKSTLAWLDAHNIPFIRPDQWPPCSPDLNPCDFALWGILEAKVNALPHQSLDSLKRAIQSEWAKIDQNILRESCMSVERRMKAVIKARGGWIQ